MNPLNMGFQTIINYSLKFFLGFMLPMSYPMSHTIICCHLVSPDVISSLVVTLLSPRHSPSLHYQADGSSNYFLLIRPSSPPASSCLKVLPSTMP